MVYLACRDSFKKRFSMYLSGVTLRGRDVPILCRCLSILLQHLKSKLDVRRTKTIKWSSKSLFYTDVHWDAFGLWPMRASLRRRRQLRVGNKHKMQRRQFRAWVSSQYHVTSTIEKIMLSLPSCYQKSAVKTVACTFWQFVWNHYM